MKAQQQLLVVFLFSILSHGAAFSAPSFLLTRSATRSNNKTLLFLAKHVNNKAAKKARHDRPKKTRPSDIKKGYKHYALYDIEKPPEFTITDEEPALPDWAKPKPKPVVEKKGKPPKAVKPPPVFMSTLIEVRDENGDLMEERLTGYETEEDLIEMGIDPALATGAPQAKPKP
mmetsp:Transcript_6360/g.9697  ORF Transcript_6360/g.9697 Transcript_6360/m.9697 type:complete len:173 (+) Transcript_6360:113-631(+)|eukprot:CAMPEP_0118698284 /NCGR_PEP_ID=MMETSP0800-20121206/15098_1 /TAXON_ID=210618 ORGANISM="Striatella unipunctata, Strain CCMP2910" /NCGR_SAMPLE_ID=MMETSP0800 /ASSEMBLY_ACC=CAM_ASM_000638 /LENGTH=172 /DNA_ID=CAMNT_0006598053 /DNA_START=91 /DNA_END=609 /DNA_ORIENTATION=+